MSECTTPAATAAPPGAWGPWRLDLARGELWCPRRRPPYGGLRLDLLACTTSAALLDWLVVVTKRLPPRDPQVAAGLLHAVVDALGLPWMLCPLALVDQDRGGRVTVDDLRARLAERARAPGHGRHAPDGRALGDSANPRRPAMTPRRARGAANVSRTCPKEAP